MPLEREANTDGTSASSQKSALNFCGGPISNLAFIEIKYIGKYTLGSYHFLFVSYILNRYEIAVYFLG